MPSTVNEQFLANPESFMQNNVLILGFEKIMTMDDLGGIIWIRVEKIPNMIVDGKPNGAVVQAIPSRTSQPDHLKVYWCPYTVNSIGRVTLGNEALFMFTPTMNGCTLGAGNYAGKGVRSVIHINCQNSGTSAGEEGGFLEQKQQAKMQRNLLKTEMGHGVKLVEPWQYMATSGNDFTLQGEATTFGVHGLDQDWEFHALRYRRSGNRYYHLGVKEIIASAGAGNNLVRN